MLPIPSSHSGISVSVNMFPAGDVVLLFKAPDMDEPQKYNFKGKLRLRGYLAVFYELDVDIMLSKCLSTMCTETYPLSGSHDCSKANQEKNNNRRAVPVLGV